ncbi:MAG: hypothetical protein KDA24_06720 [Deltaproteobacteria bacterium]|nr:hypothetical protein [Deltaproteobacteria bacterium]
MTDERDPRLDAALQALARPPEASAEVEGAEARLGATKQAVASETGFVTTVRQLPTPARLAIAAVAMAALATIVLLVNARADLGEYPALRLAMEGASSAALALILTSVALRGPHKAAASSGVTWGLAIAAVALPAALALVPPENLMLPGAKGGEGTFVKDVMACFLYGSAAALPILGTLAVLQRLPPTRARVSALAAAGAGLGGVLALQMHCPIALRDHLLIGHATVPLAAMLVILLVRRAFGGKPR